MFRIEKVREGNRAGLLISSFAAYTAAIALVVITPARLAKASPTPNCTPGSWTAAAPYPTNIARYAFAQVGQDSYVISGVIIGADVVNTVRRYNGTTNVWTPLANIPIGSEAPAGAFFGGKIFVADGGNDSPILRIYDIAMNTWSAGPARPGPTSSYGAAAGAFNGNFYVVGGGFPPTTTLSIYNIAGNTWSAGPAAPSPYLLGGYTQIGQFLYLIGSFTSTTGVNTTISMRLDMATNTWSTGPVWTPARADFALAAAGTKLIAIGGDSNGGGFFDESAQVDELDTSTWPGGAWVPSLDNLPSPRQANPAGFFSTGRVGGEIWSTGGIAPGDVFLNEHLFRASCGPTPTPTPTPLVSISGTVLYCSNPVPGPVPNVTLTLSGTMSGSTLSDGFGNYAFSSLASGGSYTITPSKVARTPGSAGITTVDVIAIQRHFLNLGTPLPGCRLTAADVNGVNGVDTVDVIATQRFFLGLSTGISNAGKYEFTPVSRSYPGVVSDQTAQNYDTVIFGDVATPFVH